MKLRFALLITICALTFAFIDSSAQDKQPKKEVIPHAQDKMPGPPLSPQEALKKMQVPPGLHVELVAAEPDIVNPVAMTFDERGRIWITESLEYPKKAAGPGIDRVKVLESTKGDGKFDKVTTVIEGLNIPSGIAIGHGGVWLANAPDIFYYPFEDFANLKLGKPQVVVTGFGRFDTHELPNSLTWGPDGWLYGLNGVFNRSVVKQDGKTFDFTCALFKIHPKTKKFELFCEGTSNPWGLAFNENGDAFVSACVIDHLWHLTETGYYHRQGGAYPPYTWKIGSIVKHKHQKAAYCGLCWFDSDAYPLEYRGKMYMGNIHGNAINCDQLEKDGSTYFAKPGLISSPEPAKGKAFLPAPPDSDLATSQNHVKTPLFQFSSFPGLYPPPLHAEVEGNRRGLVAQKGDGKAQGVGPGSNFLLANDAWFMPVVQKVGPDGCLYILDWYDRYHCYQDANRDPGGIDRLKGRLYRVVYGDYKPGGKFDLTTESYSTLIGKLANRNGFTRETALRILQERFFDEHKDTQSTRIARMELLKLIDSSTDRQTRLNALWTLHSVMNYLPGSYLNHSDPAVRAWEVRFVGAQGIDRDSYTKLVASAKEAVPDIQLQVAIAARKLKGVDPLPVLLDVLTHCGDDKLIPHIVWQNLHPLLEKDGERFLTMVSKVDLAKSPGVAKVLPRAIDRIIGNPSGDPAAVVAFLDRLANDKASATAALCLNALSAKVQNGEIAGPQLEKFKKTVAPVLPKFDIFAARFLSVTLGEKQGVAIVRDAFEHGVPENDALLALDALITGAPATLKQSLPVVLSEIPRRERTTIRSQTLQRLGKLNEPWVATHVLEQYPRFNDDEKAKAIELMTQRPAWAKSLFAEIAEKKISKDVVNVNQARRLLATKDADLKKLIEKHWGIPRDARNPEREKVVAQMKELYAKSPGDPKAGVPVFKKLCAQCHKMYGEGVDVGPDITSNGRADFDQLLSNIFDPALVIGAGYQTTIINTKQGQSISGLLVEDNAQRVVMKVQGGELKTIARVDVEDQILSKLSMMPEDLEKQLRPQEIVDLLAYLSLDRPPEDAKAKRIPGTPR